MNFDEDSLGAIEIKRLSVNTRLSTAKIFEEDSMESLSEQNEPEISEIKANKGRSKKKESHKMKTIKKKDKGSPYKGDHSKKHVEYEMDQEILARRQKQIDYGKNTTGYDNYVKQVPKHKRKKEHPTTPVKHMKYSRRGWDCLIKIWRLKLHEFDDEETAKNETVLNSFL